MYREGMLIDVSHMRPDALEETFALLDRLDAESGAAPADHPVISSHAGFRFGKQTYALDEAAVRRVAARDGVIGLILAQHQLNDGLVKKTTTFEQSFDVIARHVDRLAEITGSHAAHGDRVGLRRLHQADHGRPRALVGPRPPARRARTALRRRGRRADPLGQRPTGAAQDALDPA